VLKRQKGEGSEEDEEECPEGEERKQRTHCPGCLDRRWRISTLTLALKPSPRKTHED
jgi:hypothetical protein